jgi:acyl-CoA synthetase (AMP-forming)/AMP-acid ligase II
MLEAYFGIIRTGAWSVPLNFRFASKDLRYCADIAEAKAIIFGDFNSNPDDPVMTNLVHTVFSGDNSRRSSVVRYP